MDQYLYSLLVSERISSKLDEEISLGFMKKESSSSRSLSELSEFIQGSTIPTSEINSLSSRESNRLMTTIQDFRSAMKVDNFHSVNLDTQRHPVSGPLIGTASNSSNELNESQDD